MKATRTSTASVLYALLVFSATGALGASAPTDDIRATVDKVVMILNDPGLKAAAKTAERREQLRQAIYVRFDFSDMARRSLGTYWRQRSPEQQKEFVRLFTDLLERAYVGRVEAYTDQKFTYGKEKVDGEFAEVNSRIVTQKGDEYSLNYRLHLVNGEWKVYDVVIENISLINNYRAQFSRIISNSSYEDLLQRMKDKQMDASSEK